jgi:hypothetical protein
LDEFFLLAAGILNITSQLLTGHQHDTFTTTIPINPLARAKKGWRIFSTLISNFMPQYLRIGQQTAWPMTMAFPIILPRSREQSRLAF